MLSNPIPRDVLVLGKYLGGVLSLFPIVVMSFTVGVVIASASPATDFDVGDLLRLTMVTPYFAVIRVNLLPFRHALIRVDEGGQQSTLILSMFIWGILTIVHSNIATLQSRNFHYINLNRKEKIDNRFSRYGKVSRRNEMPMSSK